MKTSVFALLSALAFSTACQGLVPQAKSSQGASSVDVAEPMSKDEKIKLVKKKHTAPAKPEDRVETAKTGRRVGDYYVHRFDGAYLGHALTLTEEVIKEEEGHFVIDYTFEEPDVTTELRVWLDGETDELLKAFRLQDNSEIELTRQALDAMLAKTVFVPEMNEAELGSEEHTCLIGPKELECELAKYRVQADGKTATLSVARSAALGGRDISGELVADDGTLIYRAQLLEMGNDAADRPSVARAEMATEVR